MTGKEAATYTAQSKNAQNHRFKHLADSDFVHVCEMKMRIPSDT